MLGDIACSHGVNLTVGSFMTYIVQPIKLFVVMAPIIQIIMCKYHYSSFYASASAGMSTSVRCGC